MSLPGRGFSVAQNLKACVQYRRAQVRFVEISIYEPGVVYIDIRYLSQIPDEASRRFRRDHRPSYPPDDDAHL